MCVFAVIIAIFCLLGLVHNVYCLFVFKNKRYFIPYTVYFSVLLIMFLFVIFANLNK